jgi:hypothetical protein
MSNTARKARAPRAQAVDATLPVMEVEYITPAEYDAVVAKQEARFATMGDARKLVGFTKPYAGRAGTISAAVWEAISNDEGATYPQVLRLALAAEQAAHKARGKAPKGTGMSAQGWLRTFGAVFE